jgi:hypothetical protein
MAHNRHIDIEGQKTAGAPADERIVRRRASKACHSCRARKVKCGVVKSGIPCDNCRADEINCVVSDSRRRKRPRLDAIRANLSTVPTIDEDEERDPETTPDGSFQATSTPILDFEPNSSMSDLLRLSSFLCTCTSPLTLGRSDTRRCLDRRSGNASNSCDRPTAHSRFDFTPASSGYSILKSTASPRKQGPSKVHSTTFV